VLILVASFIAGRSVQVRVGGSLRRFGGTRATVRRAEEGA
jgi:hypothetical protein